MSPRPARALLCAALLAGSALGVTAPAQAATATITGHVTDAASGDPVQACLSATSESTWETVDTCADDTGAYTLPAGAGDGWVVQASADGYALQYARGHYDWNSADRLSSPGTADFAMVRASAVHATFREASGAPVPWAYVEAVDPVTGETVATNGADEQGVLDLSVRAGRVELHVEAGARDVWLGGDGTRAQAQVYTVPADGPLELGDVALPAPTRIVGRLTDATGAPVPDVCAQALAGGWGEGCSDADGRYAVEVNPGATQVQLYSRNPDFASSWLGGSYTKASAATITAVAHQDVTVDQVVPRAARITTRAVAADGSPVEGACPTVYLGRTTENAQASGDCSGPDGTISLTSVPATGVTLSLTSPRGVITWAPGRAVQRRATVLQTAAGATTTVPDVRMLTGRSVVGRVLDAATGAPVPGVWVTTAYGPRMGGPDGGHAVQTDANGPYELDDLSGNSISLVAWDMGYDYAPDWTGDAPLESRAVPVHLGATPATADFALQRGGVVDATVTKADGSPLDGSWVVDAYSQDGKAYGSSSDLYPAGDTSLTIRCLPDAPLRIRLQDPESGQVFWYGGTDADAATPVKVKPGQTLHLTITQPAS